MPEPWPTRLRPGRGRSGRGDRSRPGRARRHPGTRGARWTRYRASPRTTSGGPARGSGGRRSRSGVPGAAPGARVRRARSGRLGEAGDHVVDGVADRLQVLEVLVVDAESDGSFPQLLLQGFDQLDEGEGVGVEVLAERGPFGDGLGPDLENVGQALADQLENLVPIERAPLHVGLSGHDSSWVKNGYGNREFTGNGVCALVKCPVSPRPLRRAGGRRGRRRPSPPPPAPRSRSHERTTSRG